MLGPKIVQKFLSTSWTRFRSGYSFVGTATENSNEVD